MRSFVSCFLFVLVAVLLPASASAQTINGCIKSNGTLKIVADAADCSSREMSISWNQQGSPGADGMDGTDGMDGEPGAEGPPGPQLLVFDVNGRELGLLVAREGNSSPTRGDLLRVFLPGIGEATAVARLGQLHAERNVFNSNASLVFDGQDCTGQAYTDSDYAGRIQFQSDSSGNAITRIWVGSVGEPAGNLMYTSFGDGPRCQNVDGVQLIGVIPATEITAEDLGLPWPGPLYVGLPPE